MPQVTLTMHYATDWNQRGVLFKQQGRFADATACYEQAIRLNPAFAEAHFNLGLLWRDLGRVDQAVSCLESTLSLRPDVVSVRTALGELYLQQGRWLDAERVLVQISAAEPGHDEAVFALAIAQHELGQFTQAAENYRRILARQPRHAAAWTNLGAVLKNLGFVADAIDACRRAIDCDPLSVAAHSNLGNSWLELGEFQSALAEYQLAAELSPNDPMPHINLGNVFSRLERIPEALAAYEHALNRDPQSIDASISCSHLWKELGGFDQAADVCRRLSCQFPSDPVHALRAAAVCPLVFRSRAEMQDYRNQLTSAVAAWADADWDLEFARWTMYAPECPYNLQFFDGNLAPLKSAFARMYAQFLSRRQPPLLESSPGPRPRIGFVVTARHEPAFVKLLGGIVERLNRRRWELVVLCSRTGAERLRAGLKRTDIAIVPFPERFDHIVATVREAQCDLLYYWEVGNDPTNYFLPFLRLAPVQVTSWGIQVTSGIPTMDAYLSSSLVETDDADQHYTERLIRAATFLTYQTPIAALPANRADPSDFAWPAGFSSFSGLSGLRHKYGCVQNLGKFHPDFDAVLADILRRDRQGVLVVTRDRNGHAADTLQARWRRDLPDVVDRIVFTDPLTQTEYWSLLASCDVLLDPLYFGGVTTTYDALALQQPIVTLPTDYHRGRYTASCLRRIGVTQTIANDCDDYARLAVELANAASDRQELRRQLADSARVLFEDDTAVAEHERIFEELLAAGR